MAVCARCGSDLPDGAAHCPECGAQQRPRNVGAETLPLGSPEAAIQVGARAATLVLGSGVALSEPDAPPRTERIPESGARAPKKPEPPHSEPKPEPRPRRDSPPEARRKFEARMKINPRGRLDPRAKLPAQKPAAKPKPKARPVTGSALHASDVKVLPRRLSSKSLVGVAVGAGVFLLVVITLLVIVARRPPKILGSVSFDLRGRPLLDLECKSCENGTRVSLGVESSKFDRGHARITLEPPVSLGERRLELELLSPNARSSKNVELNVPVGWVISGDLRGLSQPVPKLAVLVDAPLEIGVIVDGHALAPTQTGTRRYEIDVRDAVSGTASGTVPLTRRVPYAITLRDGTVNRGELELETEIVPLRIEAPGESIVIEGTSFTLAGNTESDATVTVEGRPITVDPSGRFAQLMSVSAVGDTTVTVRASAPSHAPRLFPIRVRRVASLAEEAKQFQARATSSYSAIAEGLQAKVGWAVALTGKIREVKSDGYSSTAMLDVENGCQKGPCPLRLRFGSRVSFAANERISAYGYLAGASNDNVDGHAVPEVRVEFARGEP